MKDEPTLGNISNTCVELIHAIEEQAIAGAKNPTNTFGKEAEHIQEQLIDVSNKYADILETSYDRVKPPILTDYEQKAFSFDKDTIKRMANSNQRSSVLGGISDGLSILSSCMSPSPWKNVVNFLSKVVDQFDKKVFNSNGFYAQFKHMVNDNIDNTFKHMNNNADENVNRITDYQNAVNDQIKDMLSTLEGMEKLSKDKAKLEQTINDYKDFIEQVNKEITYI